MILFDVIWYNAADFWCSSCVLAWYVVALRAVLLSLCYSTAKTVMYLEILNQKSYFRLELIARRSVCWIRLDGMWIGFFSLSGKDDGDKECMLFFMYSWMYMSIYVCMCIWLYACEHVCMFVRMHANMCIYIHISVF